MALQFNEGSYGQAFQQGQANELANKFRPFQALEALSESIGKFGTQERERKLYELQLTEAMRKGKESEMETTPLIQLLSGNRISEPTSLMDNVEMPQGMGEAALPPSRQPGGMIAKFRDFQSGKLRVPQMSPQKMNEWDATDSVRAFGLPEEALSMTPKQIKTMGEARKLFAQPGVGDYDQQLKDLNLQLKQAQIDNLKSKGSTGLPKPPSGYRYKQDGSGELEAIPGGPAVQKSNAINTTYELYKTAREGLLSGLKGSATGPIVGRIPAFTSEQQIAEGAVAAMAPVLKQLFRVAGEGVFTDRDQALLMQMIPTRQTRKDAAITQIENIDAIVRAKLGIQEEPSIQEPKAGSAEGEAKPRIQVNRKTGKKRISYDGGQTWQPM